MTRKPQLTQGRLGLNWLTGLRTTGNFCMQVCIREESEVSFIFLSNSQLPLSSHPLRSGLPAAFLCDKMSCSERIAADITSEFSFACQVDASIGKALSLLDTYDLRLTKDRAKELIPLLVDLSNHTRKWSNCGFTPEEIHQQKIRSSSVRQGRKIGRNEPCPCGSGKKYKKCCGF